MTICNRFTNLRDRVTNASKSRTISDIWTSSVRNVLSSAFRCRKCRGTLKSISFLKNIFINFWKDYKQEEDLRERLNSIKLTQSQKKSLMIDTIEERNSDRNKELSTFLNIWPFLKEEDSLRMEFRILKGLKNLNYLNKRLLRKIPGDFIY